MNTTTQISINMDSPNASPVAIDKIWRIDFDFTIEEDAIDFAKSFPKSSRAKLGTCGKMDGTTAYSVYFNFDIAGTGKTGVANEAGIKRIKRIFDIAKSNGINIQ